MATKKLIKALKLVADRINDFVETNREILGEANLNPYGFMAFCSFLVIAGYAPSKKYFPDSVINRSGADTTEFRQTVVESMTGSLLDRHSAVSEMIEGEDAKERRAEAMRRQVTDFLENKYDEYFGYFKKDIEKLAEEQTGPYANLSRAFIEDVLGETSGPESGLAPGNATIGLCLSTTVSGLMSFFDSPDDKDLVP